VLSWKPIARRVRVPVGFLFAAAYLWLARPTTLSIIVGSTIVLLGLAIRALASGHITKNEQLTTTGPYAHTRNPLYLGSLVLALGFVIAARSLLIALVAIGIFFSIYLPVIRAEEEFLRERFPKFSDYFLKVPRLFPRIRSFQSSANGFSRHLYWKHREYNAAIGALLMVAGLLMKHLWFGR
jgi:protein-S-isoprenylcysteine O-methyltransferase Ste14